MHYDQRVAEMVRRGDVDLGVVPARAFDELGVTSLQALQAPFLLTGDDALDAVVTGTLRDDLMSGLPAAGYEGLALWPDELRHPFSFGAPILKLGDFRGVSVLSPFSRRSWDLMGALGAQPQDPNDRTVTAGGAEAGYRTTANVNRPGVITGNVTFYPKIQALVAGSSTFSRLTDEQQRFVREAATATTAWVVEHRQHEDAAEATYCRGGGVVVLADASDRGAIEAAAAPVYADLETDPLTKRLIGEIWDIVAAPRAPTVRRLPVRVACQRQPDHGRVLGARPDRRSRGVERDLPGRHQRGLPRFGGHQPKRRVLQWRHLHPDVQGWAVHTPPGPGRLDLYGHVHGPRHTSDGELHLGRR